MFNEPAIIVREIGNGALFVSAIFLMIVFIRYIYFWGKRIEGRWYKDHAILFAGATTILLFGHAARAFQNWMTFLLLDLNFSGTWWSNNVQWYIFGTMVIIVGKSLMVFFFTVGTRPQSEKAKTRRQIYMTALMLGLSISIPVLIALFINWVL